MQNEKQRNISLKTNKSLFDQLIKIASTIENKKEARDTKSTTKKKSNEK